MLKHLILTLGLASTLDAMPPVNSPSDDVPFETFGGAGLTQGMLKDHEGKIIVVTYYTPW